MINEIEYLNIKKELLTIINLLDKKKDHYDIKKDLLTFVVFFEELENDKEKDGKDLSASIMAIRDYIKEVKNILKID